jgi:adenylate cyclase
MSNRKMGNETERRFLVRGEAWRKFAKEEVEYRQGYLSLDPDRNVRIRASADDAVITIKGKRQGLTRSEFEYPISLEDASLLLFEVCQKPLIYKTRFTIPANQQKWEVDGIPERKPRAHHSRTGAAPKRSHFKTRMDWRRDFRRRALQ